MLSLARVRGRSMEPTLRDGDVVVVRSTGTPRIGRIHVVSLPPDPAGAPRPVSVKRITGVDPTDPRRYWVESDNAAAGVSSWDASVGSLPRDAVHAVVLGRLPRRAALSPKVFATLLRQRIAR